MEKLEKLATNQHEKNMKKTSAVILAISFLVVAGCSEKTTETIQERNGLAYLPNETTPFTGTKIAAFPNGQKKSEINYKDGKPNGLMTMWLENGQKEAEINYKDGEQNLLTTFFENGQKKSEGNFKDGKPNGLMTTWFENGQKEAEGNFKDGQLIN